MALNYVLHRYALRQQTQQSLGGPCECLWNNSNHNIHCLTLAIFNGSLPRQLLSQDNMTFIRQPPEPKQTSTLARVFHDHHLLTIFGIWSVVTGLAMYRVHRQPFARSLKGEQYETIFKGTTLGAVLAAIATGSFRRSSGRQNR